MLRADAAARRLSRVIHAADFASVARAEQARTRQMRAARGVALQRAQRFAMSRRVAML